MNNDLRKKIVEMITRAKEGHIPSSFSIIDIIENIYKNHLRYDSKNPEWEGRDYFILSKGHGAAALFIVLKKYGFISENDIKDYGKFNAILGGHPDRTKVPGVEASTGSLGHGFPFSIGIALGEKIKNKNNKVFVLCGDGECHEGTIWEAALVAQNLRLDNLCVTIDYNGSAAQILPHPDIINQWKSFGWEVAVVDGHSDEELNNAYNYFKNNQNSSKPLAVIANTIKGKGVSFLETHGSWHHRIPNEEEYKKIIEELS